MPPAQSHSLNGLSMREPTQGVNCEFSACSINFGYCLAYTCVRLTSLLQKLSNPNVYPSQDPTIAGTNGPQDDTAPNCPKTKETVTELNVVAAINLPMKTSLGGQEL
eukprot:CAMPEP_0183414836 /NCGR_PEP_ID=MMETSP0370-20130417/22676_1 /TAXON_ID=268820 /ORGANISM="Peridinium aciculiferum, Strain PAER-2" /LENGTH=106 /DNA_ID=CAMNT_0025598193 /DNA_START=247 /DNA_END=563 /DNA_ORIENTATION=-